MMMRNGKIPDGGGEKPTEGVKWQEMELLIVGL